MIPHRKRLHNPNGSWISICTTFRESFREALDLRTPPGVSLTSTYARVRDYNPSEPTVGGGQYLASEKTFSALSWCTLFHQGGTPDGTPYCLEDRVLRAFSEIVPLCIPFHQGIIYLSQPCDRTMVAYACNAGTAALFALIDGGFRCSIYCSILPERWNAFEDLLLDPFLLLFTALHFWVPIQAFVAPLQRPHTN